MHLDTSSSFRLATPSLLHGLSARRGRDFAGSVLLAALLGIAGAAHPVAAEPASAPSPGDGLQVELLREGLDGFEARVRIPEPEVREIRLEDDRVFTTVALPGFGTVGEPGQPDLPVSGVPFALPAGMRAELSFEILATSEFRGGLPLPVPRRSVIDGEPFAVPVEEFEMDPGAYTAGGSAGGETAGLGEVAGWRFHRIQSVLLRPVRFAPGAGTYTVARELRISVRFVPDGASAPRGERVPAGPDHPLWEQAADRMLINGESARRFATRTPVRPLGVVGAAQGNAYVRVRIGGSGMTRISYASLAEAGFPAGVPLAEVRVEERGYDRRASQPQTVVSLPRTIEDANGNGVFDEGDHVRFVAFNYQDRFRTPFWDTRYTHFHTYWLTRGAGTDFPTREGDPVSGGEAVTSFPHTVHNEENDEYINFPDDTSGEFLPQRTTLYWLGPFFTDADETFNFEAPDPVPGGTTRLFASWQGAFVIGNQSVHRVSLDINSTRVLNARQFIGTQTLDWSSGPLATNGLLNPGTNSFTVTGRGITDNVLGSGAYFDRLEVTYDRLLRARSASFRFNSGDRQGLLRFTVTDFGDSDVRLYDVTDPVAPVRILGRVTDAGGGSFTLEFEDQVGTTRREYLAVIPAGLPELPPSRHSLPPDLVESGLIGPGLTRDLLAEGEGSDYILVVHPSTREAWGPLVEVRESQGHQVLLCDVWEIYDQFAGGNKTPWAIQHFLQAAFNGWSAPPSYLVLGGDASEDYRTETPNADPDWVPTMMHLANVPGALRIRELAGTDTWYVSFLPQGQSAQDVVPDMFVGRLPVGNLQQARDVVAKIVAYEAHDPAETWRNRAVLLADDQYSTSITGTSSYCWKSAEGVFTETVQDVADSIRVAGHLPDFDARLFLLADYLDDVPETWRNPGAGDCPVDSSSAILPPATTATATYTRREVTPGFLNLLNQGALMWGFTGHANKNTITTETLFIHNEQFIGSDQRDVDRLTNFGRPFLFMGYACHLAEFEYSREKQVGESIGEALLLAPNRGAVATFASTGYEWLHTNRDAQMSSTAPLFWQLPVDGDTGRPRRILGEATTLGLIDLAVRRGFVQDFAEMLRTYQLLGDPALKVDVNPPVFTVNLNGEAVENGTPLRAASFDDSLLVEARVFDDTNLDDIEVYEGETRLPGTRLNLELPPNGSDGGKEATLSFRTAIRLADYDVTIRTREWFGREVDFTLPVRFRTRFYDGERLLDPAGENLLDSLTVVRIEVESPVPLEAGQIDVLADGTSLGLTPVESSDEGRTWTYRTEELWRGGPHDLQVVISAGGESLTRELSFTVPTDEVALASAYFYPNPYARGPAHFAYRLTNRAEDVDLAVYTVRGRRIRQDRIQGDPGWNYFEWNLRDDAGDEVANGVYLFVLRVRGAGGEDIRHIEKVAVAR